MTFLPFSEFFDPPSLKSYYNSAFFNYWQVKEFQTLAITDCPFSSFFHPSMKTDVPELFVTIQTVRIDFLPSIVSMYQIYCIYKRKISSGLPPIQEENLSVNCNVITVRTNFACKCSSKILIIKSLDKY